VKQPHRALRGSAFASAASRLLPHPSDPVAEVQELQLRRTSHIEERRALPVLRGFSRNVKQDSETSAASGGVSVANVSPWRSTVRVASTAFRLPCAGKVLAPPILTPASPSTAKTTNGSENRTLTKAPFLCRRLSPVRAKSPARPSSHRRPHSAQKQQWKREPNLNKSPLPLPSPGPSNFSAPILLKLRRFCVVLFQKYESSVKFL
jgi:hypothetical protein